MNRCIIVGASVASSLSAYVMAPFFEEIVLLDCDEGLGDYRKNLQQGTQFHIFLAKGQETLRELIPNIEEDFIKENCPQIVVPKEMYWSTNDGLMARSETPMAELFLMDRMALERILLKRLKDHKNIRIETGVRVQDIMIEDGRALGVRAKKSAEELDFRGDLVVIGAGRGFPLGEILNQHGLSVPEKNFVPAEFTYLSQIRRLVKGDVPKWKIRYEQAIPPERIRGAVMAKVAEPDQYMFMLGGMKGGFPKMGEEHEFMNALASKDFLQFYENSEAVSKPQAYRINGSQHRPYGKLGKQWPRSLLAMGDSVCAFNPVYGQGLTVASLEAKALKTFMTSVEDCTASYKLQKEFDHIIKAPWLMGTMEDRKLYGQSLKMSERIVAAYMKRLLRLATNDSKLSFAFTHVVHMLRGPESLFRPDILWRVLKG